MFVFFKLKFFLKLILKNVRNLILKINLIIISLKASNHFNFFITEILSTGLRSIEDPPHEIGSQSSIHCSFNGTI